MGMVFYRVMGHGFEGLCAPTLKLWRKRSAKAYGGGRLNGLGRIFLMWASGS